MLIFLAILGTLFFFFLQSDPAKVILKDNILRFFTKSCDYQIPVNVISQKRDSIESLSIERKVLELLNGDKVIYEIVSLPAKYAFDKNYDDILEEIFNTRIEKIYYRDGFALYRGDFAIALFFKTKSDLILIYPADDLEEALIGCFENGEQKGLVKRSIPLQESQWSIKQIILDGLINKDI